MMIKTNYYQKFHKKYKIKGQKKNKLIAQA